VTVDLFADFVKETGYDVGSKCNSWEDANYLERSGVSFRNPGFPQDGSYPAVCLNWNDAKAYVAWLSKSTGKSYRLLTEAEWEYVARAGTTTRYFFGDDENAFCRYGNGADQTAKNNIAETKQKQWEFLACSDGYAYTAPVGSFLPNPFGLYDMHGNAWQWVEDCWHENYQGAPTDGSSWTTGDCGRRVYRGGSWDFSPWGLNSATRWSDFAQLRGNDVSFRVARTLSP
jgi:formylglycine-generating enzyme required for sulfatase activity